MNREKFREQVFERDSHKCVYPGCRLQAVDAHHIIERKLWSKDEDYGYFMENGVSVCEKHHKLAERIIPTQLLRKWAGIEEVVIPKTLDRDNDYDKWGNALWKPSRVYIKYPSTPYLPFSESPGNLLMDIESLLNIPLVVTIKMDGSNVVLTNEKVAARNGLHANHPSFSLLKADYVNIQNLIPAGLQIFGEWLYAKHSIAYTDELSLDSYLQVFGVYDTETRCFLGWKEVTQIANSIGCPTVPVLSEVEYCSKWEFIPGISKMAKRVIEQGNEGIVVRPAAPFHYGHFRDFMGKYVRMDHIETDKHWKRGPVIRNHRERI